MKEKNEAVIANTAIRALCCFRALSFEGFFFLLFLLDNRVEPQNSIIKRKKEADSERNIFQVYGLSHGRNNTLFTNCIS